MIDFINSLRGKKHCPWCVTKELNFIEKWAGVMRHEQNLAQHIVWVIYDNGGFGIWRFGQSHHYKHHIST